VDVLDHVSLIRSRAISGRTRSCLIRSRAISGRAPNGGEPSIHNKSGHSLCGLARKHHMWSTSHYLILHRIAPCCQCLAFFLHPDLGVKLGTLLSTIPSPTCMPLPLMSAILSHQQHSLSYYGFSLISTVSCALKIRISPPYYSLTPVPSPLVSSIQ